MRSVAVAAAVAGLVAAPGAPARAEPTIPAGAVVTQPDWRVKPNGDDLAEQYPAVAQFVGLGGRALLHCAVAVDGATEACKVVEEKPAGLGFGAAALAFAKTFQMKPMTVDGRPVDGGTINIPIHFQPPAQDEGVSPAVAAAVAALAPGASSPAGAPSARSAELARKIADATLGVANIKPLEVLARATLERQFGGSKLTPAERAALDDYVEAVGATLDARITATAEGYAELFSEKELADIEGFFGSPSGRAWLERSTAYASKVDANLAWAVQAEARKRFCAKFDCPDAPAAAPSAAAK